VTEPVRAAIYTRISLASLGDTTKTDDQERICRDLAGRLGWEVVKVYTDANKSAWNRRVRRRGWEAMLGAVEAGEITGIITYHGDRLVRQPRDLEKLIDLANGKGIRLASPTGERNLDKSEDRVMARVVAAFAEAESARTSERRKGQYDRWRRSGKVRAGGRGGRPFGFRTDGVTHIPAEVAVIRELADRVLAGEPCGHLARELTARKVKTPAGNPFSHATIRKMLARPRLAGLMPDGVSPAAWEPVLDRTTWEAVVAALDEKATGFAYATNARKYLLSGIAVCGVCGSPLQARSEGVSRRHLAGYGCVKPGCRKVQRSVRHLDAYVMHRLAARLAQPGNPVGQIPAAPGLAVQFATLSALRAETETAIEDPASGTRLPLLLARLNSIDARLAELRQMSADDASARLVAAHAGAGAEQLAGLPLAVRRALVAACYRVTVLPASKRGPGFEEADVVLTPR
jgi:DNA invertase Pin-like site-specific DNA recombinase